MDIASHRAPDRSEEKAHPERSSEFKVEEECYVYNLGPTRLQGVFHRRVMETCVENHPVKRGTHGLVLTSEE
ncbi:hypothetical protein NDU88_006549 [Pleurodeles waltl]|uniref:Uncharacterized protein n=1 Tax=Pleurodeles waltl TaxID=8319 RepID=A0AAV7TYM3_PLEWA|nr:hypothetical protein NDU88_006549 [Pleurodeles waltl]